TAEAMDHYRRALVVQEKLARENPLVTEYQDQLVTCYSTIAYQHKIAGRADEALELYRASQEILEQLARKNPDVIQHRSRRIGGLLLIGDILQRSKGKNEEALGLYRQALEGARSLSGNRASDRASSNDEAECDIRIGRVLDGLGRGDEAIQSYRAAIPFL